jgi:hypothetical protein
MVWQLDMVNSKTDRIAVESLIMIDVRESSVISLHLLVCEETLNMGFKVQAVRDVTPCKLVNNWRREESYLPVDTGVHSIRLDT